MSEHALLSASSSSRWIACPGSVALCKDIPSTTSKFAEEGTLAHELASLMLLNYPSLYGVEDEERLEYLKKYVKLTHEYTGNGTLMVEKRIDYSAYIGVPDSFGTADALIISEDGEEVTVIDLKYGKGIVVHAEENSQLMLYALGAIDEVSVLGYNPKRVRLVIHQPRLDHISEWDCTVEELMEFAVNARRSAELAINFFSDNKLDASALYPGETQCRFCPAKASCPALVKFVAKYTDLAFENLIDEPTPEELTLVEEWARAKRAELEKRLFDGEKLQHWKLVEGRKGARAWSDAALAEKLLKSFRLKKEEMYDLKLISPTSAEKLFKEQPRRWSKVEELITRKDGAPSVAPVSDKRPALQLTAIDTLFEVIETPEGE